MFMWRETAAVIMWQLCFVVEMFVLMTFWQKRLMKSISVESWFSLALLPVFPPLICFTCPSFDCPPHCLFLLSGPLRPCSLTSALSTVFWSSWIISLSFPWTSLLFGFLLPFWISLPVWAYFFGSGLCSHEPFVMALFELDLGPCSRFYFFILTLVNGDVM